MKFGLFEHMDDSGVPLGRQFESRLSLLEACDRYGFYAYHLAPSITGRRSGLRPLPACFSPRSRSGRSVFALVLSRILCRSITQSV